MIKPDEFNFKLEDLGKDYNETYEMFEYLDKSRDGYIEENTNLKLQNKFLTRLCFYFFFAWLIEFLLFLIFTL